MDILNIDQVSNINKTALAKKHKVSSAYVSLVLTGKRATNTQIAKNILADGHRLISVLEN